MTLNFLLVLLLGTPGQHQRFSVWSLIGIFVAVAILPYVLWWLITKRRR